MGARRHGNNENVVLLLRQEVEREEKVNERRAFPNARLSAAFFLFFFFPFKSFILIFNYESKKTKCLLNEPAATHNKLTHPSQICGD